ncbi:MAG: ATP-binding protein [Ectothiorhodospiraceae bacterium]|jgi:hypothetical protein
MTFNVATLFVIAVAYLLLLFLVAYATEQRWLPARLVRHPAVYVLSLGVYATTWSYYGSVGFADRQGLMFVTIYLGVALVFTLGPVLLAPLLRLTRTHQLTSIADIFAYRFDSQLAGVLVTLTMLTGSLPYIALQIRAVVESTQVLSGESSAGTIAPAFCVMVTVFTVIFGARHVTPREKHTGLVAAIAFESLLKLAALLTVGWVALKTAFGGPVGLNQYLDANPQLLEAFFRPVDSGPWGALLFLAFAAAFLLPRQFHMMFTENLNPAALRTASWGFPLYLLLLSLAIPPILWAAHALQPQTTPDYHVLGIAMLSASPGLALSAYIGGISAASAMIIVSTLALSSMTLNHLVLPLFRPDPERDFYAGLRWARRVVIAAVIGAGYLFYLFLERSEGLVSWGLISFLAMAQFIPGLVGVLYWPRATRTGVVAGLCGGGGIWLISVLIPALTALGPVRIAGVDLVVNQSVDHYSAVTFWSVAANALLFAVVSLLTRPTPRAREAAAACRDVSTSIPQGALVAQSPAQFADRLAPVTGREAARAEVDRALRDLGLEWAESRPDRLQQLREQIERNLSGMMGPVLARLIVDERLQLDTDTRSALAQNVRLVEERLERSRSRLRGLAGELDRLRRYHRQILEDLPLGVVAVTPARRIVRWNPAMQKLTGIAANRAVGLLLDNLPPPWGSLLDGFLADDASHAYKRRLQTDGPPRWLTLHRAFIGEPGHGETGDRLLLVEDVTDLQRLEEELAHSERLASIGRLAAGVAHEIGNPITGIACLAQEMREQVAGGELQEQAEQILEQTQRINTIVQTLVSYAHAGDRSEREPVTVSLHAAVEEARRVVHLSKRGRSVTFENAVPEDILVVIDSQRLIQVFVNLFTNAVDACEGLGRVEIHATRNGSRVDVSVSDNGPGIPAGLQGKVLEPFFTTKSPGQGTGLGLPLVYNIIREYNGELALGPRGNGNAHGTEVRFDLPGAAPVQNEANRHA